MKIETLIVSPFEVNCYLIWDEDEKKAIIIDPGDEDELIIDTIGKLNLQPAAILLTHGHADHIAAVEPLKDKYGIKLYIGKGDESLLESPSANVSALMGFDITCPPADKVLTDKDVLKIGGIELTVIATPGHSRGGVCYFVQNKLFCGDTLFNGSIGRTDLPGGDYQQLIDSINKNILSLPDEIICYPGHGPSTTVGEERRNNPFLSGNRFV